VNASEFVSLLGPNACGKTTALKIMAGILLPDSGSALLDNEAIGGPSPNVVMVFQHLSVFPWKTCEQNVEFGLKARGIPVTARRSVVQRYLEMLGLRHCAAMFPRQLSGGLQQRLALAQALAVDPEVLLMDEPFRSLDTQTTELLEELVLRLWHDSRRTIVFVSHSVEEAVFLSDRVLVMTRRPGRVAAEVAVDLPRPRTPHLRVCSKFAELRNTIWDMLRKQYVSSESLEEIAHG
jgi:ABC-type nitrate/sulfonate/bicarbonate transport system ATPase subunit